MRAHSNLAVKQMQLHEYDELYRVADIVCRYGPVQRIDVDRRHLARAQSEFWKDRQQRPMTGGDVQRKQYEVKLK
jgi:hypothetical protein